MSKTLWVVGGLIVVIVVIIAVVSKNASEMTTTPTPSVSASVSATPTPSVSASATPSASASAVKIFNVKGGPFYFDLKEIKVKKGDTVKIVFTNLEGMHDWVVDEFKARTKIIAAGKVDEVTFVADKTGTFEYYCSVGQHRQMGMKGNLIVE